MSSSAGCLATSCILIVARHVSQGCCTGVVELSHWGELLASVVERWGMVGLESLTVAELATSLDDFGCRKSSFGEIPDGDVGRGTAVVVLAWQHFLAVALPWQHFLLAAASPWQPSQSAVAS